MQCTWSVQDGCANPNELLDHEGSGTIPRIVLSECLQTNQPMFGVNLAAPEDALVNETGDEATRDKEYPKLAGNPHYHFGRTMECRGRNCSGLCWNRVSVPESLSKIDARFYLRRQHYTYLSCKIKCQIAASCLRAKHVVQGGLLPKCQSMHNEIRYETLHVEIKL